MCATQVRHGLYAMDIFPMWKRTLNWQRMLLFSTFPLMTMPVSYLRHTHTHTHTHARTHTHHPSLMHQKCPHGGAGRED